MGIKNSIKFKLSRGRRGRRGRRGTRRIRKRTRQIRRLRRARLTRRIRQGSRQYIHGGDPPSMFEKLDGKMTAFTGSISGLTESATKAAADRFNKGSALLENTLETKSIEAQAVVDDSVANAKALGLGFISRQASNVASFADKFKSQ